MALTSEDLPHWAAEQSKFQAVFRLGPSFGIFWRQQFEKLLLQSADIMPVFGGEGQHGETERMELGKHLVLAFQAIHLVDGEDDGLACPGGRRPRGVHRRA